MRLKLLRLFRDEERSCSDGTAHCAFMFVFCLLMHVLRISWIWAFRHPCYILVCSVISGLDGHEHQVKVTVFRDVTQCSFLGRYTLDFGAAGSSETSVPTYKTTGRYLYPQTLTSVRRLNLTCSNIQRWFPYIAVSDSFFYSWLSVFTARCGLNI